MKYVEELTTQPTKVALECELESDGWARQVLNSPIKATPSSSTLTFHDQGKQISFSDVPPRTGKRSPTI